MSWPSSSGGMKPALKVQRGVREVCSNGDICLAGAVTG